MARQPKRRYNSDTRRKSAEATKGRILEGAKALFTRRGIDPVTMAEIAEKAEVSVPTIYAVFGSKEGILRALLRAALFGERFQKAVARLSGVTDPVQLIAMTAGVSRAVYEGERADLGMIRGSTAFSPALRKLEQEFEQIRLEMQRERLERLFLEGKQKEGLTLEEARDILWMYTSRDVYRMLAHERAWGPARYERWLAETLVTALIAPRYARKVLGALRRGASAPGSPAEGTPRR